MTHPGSSDPSSQLPYGGNQGPYPAPQTGPQLPYGGDQGPYPAPQTGPQSVFVHQIQTPSNGLGVAGFVCGLLGLVFVWVPFLGFILAILGVILGGIGIPVGKKSGAGTGLAIAGLVLGLIALVPAILFWTAVGSST